MLSLGKTGYCIEHDSTPVNNYRKGFYVNENLSIKFECFMNCIKFHKLEISNCMSLHNNYSTTLIQLRQNFSFSHMLKTVLQKNEFFFYAALLKNYLFNQQASRIKMKFIPLTSLNIFSIRRLHCSDQLYLSP